MAGWNYPSGELGDAELEKAVGGLEKLGRYAHKLLPKSYDYVFMPVRKLEAGPPPKYWSSVCSNLKADDLACILSSYASFFLGQSEHAAIKVQGSLQTVLDQPDAVLNIQLANGIRIKIYGDGKTQTGW